MRCPYCGGLNSDRATFCVNCGRDMSLQLTGAPGERQQPPQQPYPGRSNPANPSLPPMQQVNQPFPQRQSAPGHNAGRAVPPVQQPSPQRQPVPASNPSAAQTNRRQPPAPIQIVPEAPAQPEAPAPFPPRTKAQLEALLPTGVQQYTVVESRIDYGKRKFVRIAYPACANWQQSATLFKALQEQQEAKLETIIIQGVLPRHTDVYAFTNGQLQFDRNIRLGDQISNRYMLETGNGFASDSVRFVLNG